jgi:hypothetical protein
MYVALRKEEIHCFSCDGQRNAVMIFGHIFLTLKVLEKLSKIVQNCPKLAIYQHWRNGNNDIS